MSTLTADPPTTSHAATPPAAAQVHGVMSSATHRAVGTAGATAMANATATAVGNTRWMAFRVRSVPPSIRRNAGDWQIHRNPAPNGTPPAQRTTTPPQAATAGG